MGTVSFKLFDTLPELIEFFSSFELYFPHVASLIMLGFFISNINR